MKSWVVFRPSIATIVIIASPLASERAGGFLFQTSGSKLLSHPGVSLGDIDSHTTLPDLQMGQAI